MMANKERKSLSNNRTAQNTQDSGKRRRQENIASAEAAEEEVYMALQLTIQFRLQNIHFILLENRKRN